MRPRRKRTKQNIEVLLSGTRKCIIYHSFSKCSYFFKSHSVTCKPRMFLQSHCEACAEKKSGSWCLESHLSFWGKKGSCLMLCVWWIRTSSENSYEITKPKFQWLHLKEKKKRTKRKKKKKWWDSRQAVKHTSKSWITFHCTNMRNLNHSELCLKMSHHSQSVKTLLASGLPICSNHSSFKPTMASM